MDELSPSPHGRLHVEIARARGIKSPTTFGLSKLIAVVECCDARFRTRSRRCRSNPDWNARGTVTFARAPTADERVRVSAWDARGGGTVECRGSGTVALASEAIESGGWIDVGLSGVDGACGTVRMRATWTRGVGGETGAAEAEAVTETKAETETVTETKAVTEAETEVVEEAESENGEMIVSTEMTPVTMEAGDASARVNDADAAPHESPSYEDTNEAEGEALEEEEEEEEEDEWVAALRLSRKAPSDSRVSVEREDAKDAPKPKELEPKMSKIWAEDSTDDIVLVSPPPRPVYRRAEEPVSTAANDRKAEVEDLHEVRHVISPSKRAEKSREAEEARELSASFDVESVRQRAPASPERPLKPAIKSPSNARRSDDIENKSPTMMTSPGRESGARVTFDERANKTPPTSTGKILVESRTPPIAQKSPPTKQLVFEHPKSPSIGASTFSMPTKAEVEEARRLATMHERAEAVFASWSW